MWPFCGCIKRSAWWIYWTTNIPLNPLKHNGEFMWLFSFTRSSDKFSQNIKFISFYTSTNSKLEVRILSYWEQSASLLKFPGIACTYAMYLYKMQQSTLQTNKLKERYIGLKSISGYFQVDIHHNLKITTTLNFFFGCTKMKSVALNDLET